MAELLADCPRCRAHKFTFDVTSTNFLGTQYGWQHQYEAFSTCRHCHKSCIFLLAEKDPNKIASLRGHPLEKYGGALNDLLKVSGFVNIADIGAGEPPEFLPGEIEAAFREGAKAKAVGCHNASATMFRLCLDLATRELLPKDHTPGLNHRTRRDLGPRLGWLFDNGRLPEAFRELSTCIKDDGNDGAHAGSLSEAESADIQDFTYVLLERLYTESERLKQAAERRKARRNAE